MRGKLRHSPSLRLAHRRAEAHLRLAESLLGTVAEKRGWLDNDLLNAVNTAIGAALVVLMARVAA